MFNKKKKKEKIFFVRSTNETMYQNYMINLQTFETIYSSKTIDE